MNKPVTKLEPEVEVVMDPLAKLREPFAADLISKLPKQSKAQKEALDKDRSLGVSCNVCGGWHHKNAVHLDYVGHAALTDRLLDVDPMWSWEPMGFAADGTPAFDRNGGLWIKLTVCGVTRLGYGSADGKSGGDAVKEIIGDAMRNAAMRFGAALDLWHKGDLHAHKEEPVPSLEERAFAHLKACAVDRNTFADAWRKNQTGWKEAMDGPAYARVVAEMKRLAAKLAPEPEPPPPAQPAADDFGLADDEIPF
jgi:hypothetical protein